MRVLHQLSTRVIQKAGAKKNSHPRKNSFQGTGFLFLAALFLAFGLIFNPVALFTTNGVPVALAECTGAAAHDHNAVSPTPGITPTIHDMSKMSGMEDMGTMTPQAGQHSHSNMSSPTPCPVSPIPATQAAGNSTGNSHDMTGMVGHMHGATITPPEDSTKMIVLGGFVSANGLVILMAAIARRNAARKAHRKSAIKAGSKIINRTGNRLR